MSRKVQPRVAVLSQQKHRAGPPVLCTISLDASPYQRQADKLAARLFAPARHAVFFAHMELGSGTSCGRRHTAERS